MHLNVEEISSLTNWECGQVGADETIDHTRYWFANNNLKAVASSRAD